MTSDFMPPQPRYLDPKVKLAWFLPAAIVLTIFWLAAVVFVFAAQPDGPVWAGLSKPVFSVALLVFLAIFLGGPIYAYNHLEYMSFTYELAETEIVIRQGVFTRNTTVIPYNRIQNVNTQRTMLDRLLGLASLEIETAGTNVTASEGILPGVRDKDKLIREILDHVERAKTGDLGSAGASAERPERALLADILKELVSLNQHIKRNGKPSEERLPEQKAHWPRMPPAPPSLRGKHD